MDLGLSVASEVPGVPPEALVDAILERVAVARRVGLDALHVGDRHGDHTPYAANVALAGRLTASWRDRLGVLVVSSMWNPVLLAEQVATLAAMADELIVVMALGEGDRHFGAVGVPVRERLALFTEGFAVTRALVDGETVSAEVGPYRIEDAAVGLGGGVSVSWWIAASATAAIRRAADLADGWLASARLTPAEAVAALRTYRESGGRRAALRRDLFVGVDAAEVATVAEPLVAAGHRGYPASAIVRGTTGEVAAELNRSAAAGFDEVLVRSIGPDQSHALRTIERLAEVRSLLR